MGGRRTFYQDDWQLSPEAVTQSFRNQRTRPAANGQERTYVVFDKLLNSRAREPPFLLVLRDQSEFVPDEIFRIQ